MKGVDTTLNYQTLAQAVVLAAIEDSQGVGPEAIMANQWLEGVDLEHFGLDARETCMNNEYIRQRCGGYEGKDCL